MKSIIFLLSAALLFSCIRCGQPGATSTKKDGSWMLTGFEKADSINPILQPAPGLRFTDPLSGDTIQWEARNVLNPAAVVRNDTVFLLYRAQDKTGTSRIGLAYSTDGLHFQKNPTPVLYPAADAMKIYEWNYRKKEGVKINPGGCVNCYFDGVEDPRIVETEDGSYFLTYTSYDGKTARLCFALSKDLVHWEKKGPVLKDSAYINQWSKSGAVIGEWKNNHLVAKRIGGKYWMYFGDTDIMMASSADLTNWQIAVNKESGKPISVLHPRMGYFDSRLVEPGPFAQWTDKGVLLIYNGSNAADYNDPLLPTFTYAAGQALFDKEQPWKLLARTDSNFLHPDKPYEKTGEVNEVCFVEGLVRFNNKWFLYYGTADSKIAVAVKNTAR